jgi:glycosyltransferase involved in cell wall biosynthesis
MFHPLKNNFARWSAQMTNWITPTAPISVIIPVGPKPHHREYLGEMLQSIADQSLIPDEIILVDDGGHDTYLQSIPFQFNRVYTHVLTLHWNCGMVAAWNCGVGLARNELCLLVGADDRLYGDCIAECMNAFERWGRDLYGYYYLGVKYSDGNEQNTACNAAMVTKTLWKHTGGIPSQAAVGAPDHIFLSMILAASRKDPNWCKARILRVHDDMLYWYRVGNNTETTRNIWPAIEAVKNFVHETWVPQDE